MSEKPDHKWFAMSLMSKSLIAIGVAYVGAYYLNEHLTHYIEQSKLQLITVRSDLAAQKKDIQGTIRKSFHEFARKNPEAKVTTLKSRDGEIRAVVITPRMMPHMDPVLEEEVLAASLDQETLKALNAARENTQ